MNRKLIFNAIAIVLATGGLVACGGGGGGDTTTTSSKDVSTVGTITGFGSVYVSGIKFDTDSSNYDVDDDDTSTDQSDLAVGMKVKVVGSINDDGVSGTANSIYYDDDVEGPIDSNSMVEDATTKSFTVLGMSVQVDANTTVFDDGATFVDLAEGDIVEVSGYFDGTQISATRIELQANADDEFEIKGTVDSYDGSTISLTLQNGSPAGPYDVSDSDPEISPGTSGQFVEVKLMKAPGSDNLEAIEIELDDEDLLDDADEDVSIHGVITLDVDTGDMMINGVPFDVNAGTEYEPTSLEGNLVDGMEAEVEGVMVDGVLIAEEIEAESEGEIEIEARVTDVVADADGINGSVTMTLYSGAALTVKSDSNTLFEDDSSSDEGDGSFTLNDLDTTTDYLEIKAYLNDASELVASKIRREDSSEETELEAMVDSFIAGSSITLLADPLSIPYSVNETTTFQVDDSTTDSAAFFSGLTEGDTVEIRDYEPADGIADEVSRETESN